MRTRKTKPEVPAQAPAEPVLLTWARIAQAAELGYRQAQQLLARVDANEPGCETIDRAALMQTLVGLEAATSNVTAAIPR